MRSTGAVYSLTTGYGHSHLFILANGYSTISISVLLLWYLSAIFQSELKRLSLKHIDLR